ncbi:MAG: hypothetical protein R2939_12155 [Kofleriaceae bacterium]
MALIDAALGTYAAELSGRHAVGLALPDGVTLDAGGASRLIAFVGHNRLMDLDGFAWPAPGRSARGAIAIACHTAAYMKDDVPASTRVPLLMTADYLFSNAAPLEAAVLAFARGEGYAPMWRGAAAAYADVQGRPVDKMGGVFVNPGHRTW